MLKCLMCFLATVIEMPLWLHTPWSSAAFANTLLTEQKYKKYIKEIWEKNKKKSEEFEEKIKNKKRAQPSG